MAKVKDVVTIDELASDFDLPSWEDIDELNIDYTLEAGSYAHREAIEEGATEEEAEEAALKAQDEASAEIYRNWHDGVERAAEELFGEHGLELVGRGKKEPYYEYKVIPKESWRDAADRIRETVNGVGYFHFNDLQEFLDSGPYTPRQAVLSHLHLTKDYPAVYGTPSARSIFESGWR
jgi:hypothetical protein